MEKAKLVKSKSSNTAIMPGSKERVGNKSRSNAEFKMMRVKKRGVYVEKQEMKDQPRLKAPPRSRPGSKKFLASVLTILSKSTTGTQYPPETLDETTELHKLRKKSMTKHNTIKQSKISKNIIPKFESKTDIKDVKSPVQLNSNQPKKTKKAKYKSRILNEELNKEASEKMLVLKSKKDITQTSSNYSKCTKEDTSNQSIKWAEFLPKLIDSETGTVKNTVQKNLQHMDERVAKCIMEGNELNMQRQMCEPSTLVSAPEKDEKLYNIFVNLLETVYDEKPDVVDAVSSVKTVKSSKIQVEIDNNVAEKLYMPSEKQEIVESASRYSKRAQCQKNEENYNRNKQQLAEYYFNSRPLAEKWSEPRIRHARPMRTIKKKWKPEPSMYPKPPASSKTQSEIVQERRSYYKKTKKKDLLNVLKQQLWIDENVFDEPDNFYQALRVMAENKRRSQKSIHFDVPSNKKDSDFDSVCRFKRRKVITPSKKIPASKPHTEQSDHSRVSPPARKYPETDDHVIHCMPESSVNTDDSSHSLEVFGFDYELRKKIAPDPPTDYSDTDTSSEGVKRINNWNRGFRTITQLWNQ